MKIFLNIIAMVFDGLAALFRLVGDAASNLPSSSKDPEMNADGLWVDMYHDQAAENMYENNKH